MFVERDMPEQEYPFKPFLCTLLAMLCSCSDGAPPSAATAKPTPASQGATVPGLQEAVGFCDFSTATLSFAGTPRQQSFCLLTPVQRYARLEAQLTVLPPTLAKMMADIEGVPSQAAAEAYLRGEGLKPDAVGGPLSSPVAHTQEGMPARYFVIHDTSTPYLSDAPFPADINTSDFVNTFRYYERKKAAHLFINRRGEVRMYHDFSVPWRATKLEDELGERSRGRFIHIELVQPRRRDPAGKAKNDALGPSPGFTTVQYLHLAQAYVAASVRAGQWMIPTYHSVMDNGISGSHDDPQNFSLADWDKALGQVLEGIR
jgi:hypothetical protein